MSEKRINLEYDALRADQSAIAEVKHGVDALRGVRGALIELAYALGQHPGARAYLVLVDSAITEARLRREWDCSGSVLRPEVLDRISICLLASAEGSLRGIPDDPPEDVARWLRDVVDRKARRLPARVERTAYEFVVLKLLILQWLTKRQPVTTKWLMQTAGCSYPTVARVLKRLGSLVERQSDRRIALRFFPAEDFERLSAMSERARLTTRFVDQSGQPRSPDAYVRRLGNMNPQGVAIGGVLGAGRHVPRLDLVGAPRLDLSVHCYRKPYDLDFVKKLDPALKIEMDPLKPANLVTHAVRHADPMFLQRDGNLPIADPLECLLDLREARLEAQASQFLRELQGNRET